MDSAYLTGRKNQRGGRGGGGVTKLGGGEYLVVAWHGEGQILNEISEENKNKERWLFKLWLYLLWKRVEKLVNGTELQALTHLYISGHVTTFWLS